MQELIELFPIKVSDTILIESKQRKLIAHLLLPSPNLNFLGIQLEILRVLSDIGNDLLVSIIPLHHGPVEYLVKVNVPRIIRLDYQFFKVLILG